MAIGLEFKLLKILLIKEVSKLKGILQAGTAREKKRSRENGGCI